MKVAFLLNPSVKRQKKVSVLLSLIEKYIKQPKEIFWVDRSIADHTQQHLTRILNENFTHLVICGGDGSLNRCIQFLSQHNAQDKIVCALLPFGTCNDFAKILGFSSKRLSKRDLTLYLNALQKNEPISFQSWKVNDNFFINNAGFGRKKPWEKSNAWNDLKKMQAVKTLISTDKAQIHGNFLMMLAANAPYFNNGLHFSKESNAQDQYLEFFFVQDVPKGRLMLRLTLGKLGFALYKNRSSFVSKISAKSLVLQTQEPISIVIDGDVKESLCNKQRFEFTPAATYRFIQLFNL